MKYVTNSRMRLFNNAEAVIKFILHSFRVIKYKVIRLSNIKNNSNNVIKH